MDASPWRDSDDDGSPHSGDLYCPRCGLTMSGGLARLTASDGQECPRCLRVDQANVPMFVDERPAMARQLYDFRKRMDDGLP